MNRLFEVFSDAEKELFLVGGAVRELARGIDLTQIDDLDFCTNALPEESLEILKSSGFVTYDVGIEFGTVGAVLYSDTEPGYPKDCQITTYRSKEYYQRGSRHPRVRYGTTLDQDLGRRDFSINSMAMDGAGRFIDPYNGLEDLKHGLLRVVGDPHETLAEDPLRILRVGRFIAKLGFHADDLLWQACRQRAECLVEISRERWLQEMSKLVQGAYAKEGIEFLAGTGVLAVILPELQALRDHQGLWEGTLRALVQAKSTASQRWAALLHAVGEVGAQTENETRGAERGSRMFGAIATRFKMDNALTKQVRAMIFHQDEPAAYDPTAWKDAEVRHLAHHLGAALDDTVLLAKALTSDSESAQKLDALAAHIRRLGAQGSLRPELPRGIGNVLMRELSLKPGPIVGEVKAHLEHLLREGTLRAGEDVAYYIRALRESPPGCLKISGESITL